MQRIINLPGSEKSWGVQGEHNETQLVITLGTHLSGCVTAVISIARRDGIIIETATQEPVNGKVSVTLSQQMTACRGAIAAQVTAYNDGGSVIGKSPIYSGELEPSLAAGNHDDDGLSDLKDQIIAALDRINKLGNVETLKRLHCVAAESDITQGLESEKDLTYTLNNVTKAIRFRNEGMVITRVSAETDTATGQRYLVLNVHDDNPDLEFDPEDLKIKIPLSELDTAEAVFCAKWQEQYGSEVSGYDGVFELQGLTSEELQQFWRDIGHCGQEIGDVYFAMPYDDDHVAYVSRYSQNGHAFNFFVPSLLRLGYGVFDDGQLELEEVNLGDKISSLDAFANSFGNKSTVLDKLGVGSQSLELEFEGEPVNKPTAWGDITGKPTSFTPSAHTHTVAQVTGALKSYAQMVSEWDAALEEYCEGHNVEPLEEPFRFDNYLVESEPTQAEPAPTDDSLTMAQRQAIQAVWYEKGYVPVTNNCIYEYPRVFGRWNSGAAPYAYAEVVPTGSDLGIFFYPCSVADTVLGLFNIENTFGQFDGPNFVQGIPTTSALEYYLSANYQPLISDLATIRSNAAAGAAKQSTFITDAGGYFNTDTVEGALQEVGSQLNGLETALTALL